MKKLVKSLFIIALIIIGMTVQSYMDYKKFHTVGLNVATNSFQTGCLLQGKKDCETQYSGEDDKSTMFRGACLDTIMDDCGKRTSMFAEWFAQGPQK